MVLAFFTISGIILVLSYSMPYNPINALGHNKEVVQFLPQGWAFFTRNPQEAQIQLYQKSPDAKWEKIHHYHSNPSNLIGLDRDMSRLLMEITYIFNDIDRSCFYDCESNNQYATIALDCPALFSDPLEFNNIFNAPLFCGEYLLTSQKTIPWAWTHNRKKIMMPNKSILLNIRCDL